MEMIENAKTETSEVRREKALWREIFCNTWNHPPVIISPAIVKLMNFWHPRKGLWDFVRNINFHSTRRWGLLILWIRYNRMWKVMGDDEDLNESKKKKKQKKAKLIWPWCLTWLTWTWTWLETKGAKIKWPAHDATFQPPTATSWLPIMRKIPQIGFKNKALNQTTEEQEHGHQHVRP